MVDILIFSFVVLNWFIFDIVIVIIDCLKIRKLKKKKINLKLIENIIFGGKRGVIVIGEVNGDENGFKYYC